MVSDVQHAVLLMRMIASERCGLLHCARMADILDTLFWMSKG